jgi:hypothetical protein
MKILVTSGELSTKDKYLLTMSPEVQKMKDQVTQVLEVKNWCIYEDVNSKDELQTILSISTPEDEIYATNSKTFMEDFQKMNEVFNADGLKVNSIKVTSGTSKAGREFITCVYAG